MKGILCNVVSVCILSTLCANSASGLTLIPKISLTELDEKLPGICLPSTIPALNLPDDFLTCAKEVSASFKYKNPDLFSPTEEIVTSHGYFVEDHTVTTKDGYILTVQRITGGPSSPPATGKPSVYLNHGIAGSSDTFLLLPGNKSLPFKLADAGYDVWLGNCRGTTYSLGHVKYNPSTDIRYWDFSFHEMAMEDVPSVIDRILEVSGNEKIFYIGYSMGSTQYFITFSEMPELNEKLHAAVMLAPVAYIGHSDNFARLLAPTLGIGLQYLINPVIGGRFDLFTVLDKYLNVSLADLCSPTALRCSVCDNFLSYAFGFDAPQTNYTNLAMAFAKMPNNFSFKTIVHYSQSINTCGFHQFDYGHSENLDRYGTATPPAYNITKITTPTYFIHGDMDNLAVPADVNITHNHMAPGVVKEVIRVDWNLFNHLDFIFAKDADILVYNKIVQILDENLSPLQ